MIVEERKFVASTKWADELRLVDCFWVLFSEDRGQSPLKSEALRWIDWRLHGLLSRFLLGFPYKDSTITFVPGYCRLPFLFLALDPSNTPDWDLLIKNCEGQRWENVGMFCEDSGLIHKVHEKLYNWSTKGQYPTKLTLMADA